MKKLSAVLLLCMALAAFAGLTVIAANDNVGETIGYVAGTGDGIVHIIGEPLTDAGLPDVLVLVGDAPVYDLITGFPVQVCCIVPDIGIRVAYIADKNEPFSAVVLWLNWDYDDAAVFSVVAGENMRYSADDVVFLSADGKYRVAFMPDTLIVCPHNGRLSAQDIEPGMEFFLWVDMITASTPALVYPHKAVLIH